MANVLIVRCISCERCNLIQYGNNPVLAECHKKPQPGNERFPYVREVARVDRICPMHKHTDKVKDIEKRQVA